MKYLTEKELSGINGGLCPERVPDDYTCKKSRVYDGLYERCAWWHVDGHLEGGCWYSDVPCGSSKPIASAGDGGGGFSGGGSFGGFGGGDAYGGGSGTISNGCGNGGAGKRSLMLE